MTPKEASKQIKVLLDDLPTKTTNDERLRLIIKVKILVEMIEEKFRKIKDNKLASDALRQKIIKKALKQFLTALDKIYEKHEEVGDSDVREKMYDAIHKSFIKPRSGYILPTRFGMFNDSGDKLVRAAIQKFLAHPEVIVASKSLKTPKID